MEVEEKLGILKQEMGYIHIETKGKALYTQEDDL